MPRGPPVSLVVSNSFLSCCFFSLIIYFPPSFFSFFRKTVLCVDLRMLCPRINRGWHCMAKSPCCICNHDVYLCLVACDHRARFSRNGIGTDTGCAAYGRVEISLQNTQNSNTCKEHAGKKQQKMQASTPDCCCCCVGCLHM